MAKRPFVFSRSAFGVLIGAAALLSCAQVSLVVRQAHANADLDRKYALESVGVLRSWDNVDGLFADYVSVAYRDYFANQSRFVLQDLSKADPLLSNAKIPYNKLIEDPEILGQLARSTRSHSILRTKIRKEGAQYRFVIEWLHSPDMEVMSRESFVLSEPRDGRGFGSDELKGKLQQALDKVIRGVPFVATVTGRDNNSVTLNIGTASGVEQGDTLIIGTLDQVKRHPLLKEVVEWRFSNTGKVQIEQVDDKISFAQVIEEEPGRQVLRQQKVLEILKKPATPTGTDPDDDTPHAQAESEEPPRLGWVSGGLNLGGFSREYSSLDNTFAKDGGGFALGVKTDSQLWITREWFTELGFNFAFWNYSQKDVATGSTGTEVSPGSGSLLGFKLAGGYSYLVTGDLFGPKGWVKLGYRSNAYSLPTSSSEGLSPITFSSLFVGLGADVPIRGVYGAILDFGFGIFNGASEGTRLSGDKKSASDVSFSLGGYYRYTQRMTFKLTLDGQFNNADFSSNRTVSHKLFTVTPAVMYFF